MEPPILTRDQAAERLRLSARVLVRYERRGLIRVERRGDREGYPPDQLGRLWTIVSLQRELGVNLAGVEAILQLRSQLDELHGRLRRLGDELLAALDEAGPGAPHA